MTDSQTPSYPPADSQTEELGTAPSGRRRLMVIAVVAAVVVAVLGSGAWAAYSFLFGGGPRPEEALPASTVAVASVDLDPSAGQKIAAIKTIRKFPSLKKSLGLETDDDLRRFIYDRVTEGGNCSKVDFDEDVKPWIGKRAAFAAVDLGEETPAPAIALQISNTDRARAGFGRIARCAGAGEDFKWAVGEDYLIASDSQDHADAILNEGEKKPLADDAGYQRWHDEVGDAGVLNFYVSKRATKYLSDLLDQAGREFFGSGDPISVPSVQQSSATEDPDPLADVRDELDKFSGLAGTVRFGGGGVELSVVAGGLGSVAPSAKVGRQVASLPADTVLAFGLGVPGDLARNLTDGFKSGAGEDSEDALELVEDQTGLRLPGDLQTLLGDSLTLSVGGDAPKDLADIESFEDVPVGLVIHGDAARIRTVIKRIEAATGFDLADVPVVVAGDGERVVLSPSEDYADELSKTGSLGTRKGFTSAVPEAERATGVLYLDFDSSWRETLLRFAGDDGSSAEDVRTADRNTEPLRSLGISSWLDDDVSHLLVKLATD